MDPCRLATGRQGACRPVAGRQGVFCKICTARNIEMLRRGPPEGLSPSGRVTGPLPPIKCVCPPPRKVIWSQKFPEKRERGRKSEAAKPCWILGLRSLGNCLE